MYSICITSSIDDVFSLKSDLFKNERDNTNVILHAACAAKIIRLLVCINCTRTKFHQRSASTCSINTLIIRQEYCTQHTTFNKVFSWIHFCVLNALTDTSSTAKLGPLLHGLWPDVRALFWHFLTHVLSYSSASYHGYHLLHGYLWRNKSFKLFKISSRYQPWHKFNCLKWEWREDISIKH